MRGWTERGLRWLVLSSVMTMGCTPHLFSPPSRLAITEGPANLEEGKTEVRGHFNVAGEVFGVEVEGVGASVRHGMTSEIEVVGSINYASLSGQREMHDGKGYSASDGPPTYQNDEDSWSLFTARAGGKWAPEKLGGHLSLSSGLGGGYSDAGGFVSTDLGLSVGYNNRYVVPFLAMSGYVSVPIGAIAHDISDDGAPADMQKSQLTYGGQGLLGLQITPDESFLLLLAGACTVLFDPSDQSRKLILGFVFDVGYRF